MYKYYMKDNFFRIMNADGVTKKTFETLEDFAKYVKNLSEAPTSSNSIKKESSDNKTEAAPVTRAFEVEKKKPTTILRKAGERPPVKDYKDDNVSILRNMILAAERKA